MFCCHQLPTVRDLAVENSVAMPIELITDFDFSPDLVVVEGTPCDTVSRVAILFLVFARPVGTVRQVNPCRLASVLRGVHTLEFHGVARSFRGLVPECGTSYVRRSVLTNRHAFAADCDIPRACVP